MITRIITVAGKESSWTDRPKYDRIFCYGQGGKGHHPNKLSKAFFKRANETLILKLERVKL